MYYISHVVYTRYKFVQTEKDKNAYREILLSNNSKL
jgi:hypothetical protein